MKQKIDEFKHDPILYKKYLLSIFSSASTKYGYDKFIEGIKNEKFKVGKEMQEVIKQTNLTEFANSRTKNIRWVQLGQRKNTSVEWR